MTLTCRQIVAAPLCGAVLMAVACSGGDSTSPPPPPPPPPPGANAISVGDNFYNPSATTVGPGSTITWTWAGANPHSVTFDDGSASSSVQTAGTFVRAFATAGQFGYFCTVHGAGVMSGTVTVQ